ncbi:hypothetical protein C4E24_05175 [ANME-1 cluster archaeon AG-394-G21]|nr:hypothetical protein [ANME-1 cluster archaeon AG-394-G21]
MDNNNARKWLKSHHDTLFPFFPYLKKRGIVGKNVIELTSEGMFWANTIGTEMAMEYLYKGKGELVSLEEKTSKIAKSIYAQ